uniref:Uncharacterized protein n=1 Tax=Salix viminalis TaxID=40686 RepID=A0A6N2MMC7_SALVM
MVNPSHCSHFLSFEHCSISSVPQFIAELICDLLEISIGVSCGVHSSVVRCRSCILTSSLTTFFSMNISLQKFLTSGLLGCVLQMRVLDLSLQRGER